MTKKALNEYRGLIKYSGQLEATYCMLMDGPVTLDSMRDAGIKDPNKIIYTLRKDGFEIDNVAKGEYALA